MAVGPLPTIPPGMSDYGGRDTSEVTVVVVEVRLNNIICPVGNDVLFLLLLLLFLVAISSQHKTEGGHQWSPPLYDVL